MQYILTEEEYSQLKFNTNQTVASLRQQITILQQNSNELQTKYDKLLVFGVSSSNEQLKHQKSKS